MISIIICTRKSNLNDLRENIASTIGANYEVIIIDNRDNQYNIFSAYNEGVKRSQYPYLCFMHDDIQYHSNDWGKKVIAYFAEEQTGAIGISGTPYATVVAGAWWASSFTNVNIIPWYAQSNQPETKRYPTGTDGKNEVVLLDGVWFCVKKSLFNQIRFDDIRFDGFHFYDIDLSLQIHLLGYKLFCVYDILIEHFSKGDMNITWINNAFEYSNKWSKSLPQACITISHASRCAAELSTIKDTVMVMLSNNVAHRKVYQTAFKQLLRFKPGWYYPPILVQLVKYLMGSIFASNQNVR